MYHPSDMRMIKAEELQCIGRFGKPHGVKGEITLYSDTGFNAGYFTVADTAVDTVIDVETEHAQSPRQQNPRHQNARQLETCIISEIDGIHVPFFFASCRPKGKTSVLVSFDGMKTLEDVGILSGKDAFVNCDGKSRTIDGALHTAHDARKNDIRGFHIFDSLLGFTGTVRDIDDTTINTLLVVDTSDTSEASAASEASEASSGPSAASEAAAERAASDKTAILVPAALIKEIKRGNREIEVSLPEGFLEI
jgi:16S rRNA processing protein RimM